LTTQKLIYDIIDFFFNDFWHFLELLILICVLRNNSVLHEYANKMREFINNIKTKYTSRIMAEKEIEKLKEQVSKKIKV